MRIRRYLLILSFCLLPGSAFAAMDPVEPQKDPVVDEVAAATKRQDWAYAAARLKTALADNPGNADYHNLYAYVLRRGPAPDMSLVFKHYHEALRLEPEHRGAHEYIGEAYLMIGNLAKAKEHLEVLDRLCFFPCEEYTGLKQAIAEHERRQAAR